MTDNHGSRSVTDNETAVNRPAADDEHEVVLRRTWPQRAAATACGIVIVSALVLSYWIDAAHSGAKRVHRIDFATAPVVSDIGVVPVGDKTPQTASPPDTVSPAQSEPGIPATTVPADPGRQDGRNGELLQPDTQANAPVNFLIVGTDSAYGLDPDDPVMIGRGTPRKGRGGADVIMLVRLDPSSGRAWALSIPRDLRVKIPRGQEHRITSALWIGGAPLLVETIATTFDVEINHYVQLDFAGFQSLVDALTGVPVWFPHPTRDLGSLLDIPEAGCHVLDGRQALQYVRGRRYEEQTNGRWRVTGGSDLSRIERQQDFLVLALDRAISRGARSPRVMAKLFESMIEMVTLDQDLTLAELLSLGEAFSDFDPEKLHRQGLQVYPVRSPEGNYMGEAAYVRKNQAILDVFSGRADAMRTSPERVRLVGTDESDLSGAAEALAKQGFEVLSAETSDTPIPATVVLHDPAHAAEAVTVARYLNPLPYVVPQTGLDDIVAVLGDDYRGVRGSRIPSPSDVESQLAARGAPAVLPDLTDLGGNVPETQDLDENIPETQDLDENASAATGLVAARGAAAGAIADLAVIAEIGMGGSPVVAPKYGSRASAITTPTAASAITTPTAASAITTPTAVTGRPPEGVSCD